LKIETPAGSPECTCIGAPGADFPLGSGERCGADYAAKAASTLAIHTGSSSGMAEKANCPIPIQFDRLPDLQESEQN
jgi:hypothetical protein